MPAARKRSSQGGYRWLRKKKKWKSGSKRVLTGRKIVDTIPNRRRRERWFGRGVGQVTQKQARAALYRTESKRGRRRDRASNARRLNMGYAYLRHPELYDWPGLDTKWY